jgi:phosphate transport system permease protein
VLRGHREASFALGLAEAPTTLRVVVPAAGGNILTGIMIATARVAGETAPLLFTAFNSRYAMEGIDQPTATIPVNIYTYAISPFPHWHDQAWAGALLLVGVVLATNALARTLWNRRARFMRGG